MRIGTCELLLQLIVSPDYFLFLPMCFLVLIRFICFRVKSLSKSGNSKKEVGSSTLNLKESTTVPLCSVLPAASPYDDDTGDSWPEQTDKDEYEEDFYEQEKPSWKKNGKVEASNFSISEDKARRANGQMKWKEPPKYDTKYSNPDDDLNVLLKVKSSYFYEIVPSWRII